MIGLQVSPRDSDGVGLRTGEITLGPQLLHVLPGNPDEVGEIPTFARFTDSFPNK